MTCDSDRPIYQILQGVKSGGGAAYLLSVARLIACKDASRFETFPCLWPPSAAFYKLL